MGNRDDIADRWPGDDSQVVRIPAWNRYRWLRHGFTTRFNGRSTIYDPHGNGDLNLGLTREDSPENVHGNRRDIVDLVGAGDRFELVALRQVHGIHILAVPLNNACPLMESDKALFEADGLMTATPGWMLGLQAADCVSLLIADTRLRVVAGFHAGWRGTVNGIVQHGITRIIEQFGSNPADLIAAIGPSIGPCCYSVGEEVELQFQKKFSYAAALFHRRQDEVYLDLAEANRRQLLAVGLAAHAISVVGECTACTTVDGRPKYFSHRAEQGFTGRTMGLIGISLID